MNGKKVIHKSAGYHNPKEYDRIVRRISSGNKGNAYPLREILTKEREESNYPLRETLSKAREGNTYPLRETLSKVREKLGIKKNLQSKLSLYPY